MVGVSECPELRARLLTLQRQIKDARREHNTLISLPDSDPFDVRTSLQDLRRLERQEREVSDRIQLLCSPGAQNPITVHGIEKTQAIQYFQFRGRYGSGLEPNNSIPLVSDKDTILRVYVSYTSNDGRPINASVTGELSLYRIEGAGRIPYPKLSPINVSIPALPVDDIMRSDSDHTLNFRIPAYLCRGSVRGSLKVFDPADPDASGPSVVASYDPFPVLLDFIPARHVSYTGVLIRYTGQGQYIAAPTVEDLRRITNLVTRLFPVSSISPRSIIEIEFDGDLSDGTGSGCGDVPQRLLRILRNMRSTSVANDVVVGLLPNLFSEANRLGFPRPALGGCGGRGAAVAFNTNFKLMAEEIGHAFRRRHAPCPPRFIRGAPRRIDSNYPNYGNFSLGSGSIGEFGFDNVTSKVHDPMITKDYMGYCTPEWTSPYTYMGLMDRIISSSAQASPDLSENREVADEYMLLNFRMYRDGRVELLPSYHLPGPVTFPGPGWSSDVSIDLLDAEGNVIQFHRCQLTDPHQVEGEPYVDFQEVIPWDQKVHSIAYLRRGELCHSLEIEEQPPEVVIEPPQHAQGQPEMMQVSWQSKKQADRPTTYLVRFSHDGGETWNAVAADLTKSSCLVNMSQLPGGEECKFQVFASAGVRTATAETEPFSMPQRPRQANISSPEADAAFVSGGPVALIGSGFSPDCEPCDLKDVVWTSNIDGVVGVGFQVITHTLSVGRHRIRLTVPDGFGGEASSLVSIEVKARD